MRQSNNWGDCWLTWTVAGLVDNGRQRNVIIFIIISGRWFGVRGWRRRRRRWNSRLFVEHVTLTRSTRRLHNKHTRLSKLLRQNWETCVSPNWTVIWLVVWKWCSKKAAKCLLKGPTLFLTQRCTKSKFCTEFHTKAPTFN